MPALLCGFLGQGHTAKVSTVVANSVPEACKGDVRVLLGYAEPITLLHSLSVGSHVFIAGELLLHHSEVTTASYLSFAFY